MLGMVILPTESKANWCLNCACWECYLRAFLLLWTAALNMTAAIAIGFLSPCFGHGRPCTTYIGFY